MGCRVSDLNSGIYTALACHNYLVCRSYCCMSTLQHRVATYLTVQSQIATSLPNGMRTSVGVFLSHIIVFVRRSSLRCNASLPSPGNTCSFDPIQIEATEIEMASAKQRSTPSP
jgi:hypothetical protein